MAPLVSVIIRRGAAAEPATSPKYVYLKDRLTRIRQESGLPALAAGAMKQGQVVASGAVGVRKAGDPTPVTMLDQFHIGSCTKAMTATLAAMCVEEGKLHWDSRLGEVFPERAAKLHPSYATVTLEMWLSHRSGAPANGRDYGTPAQSVREQRLAYLDSVVTQPPQYEPGTRYSYSNAGYIIVGAILERITGEAWERLIQDRLFRPLGMTSAGFGPPSKPNQVDQPWGHIFKNGRFEPRYGDNPPALGPAGTVHCAVLDYLKFADLHAAGGTRGPRLLKPATFVKLHQPAPKQDYASGWLAVERGWAQGHALTHAGSNTMNYFVVWIAPKTGLCVAVAANAAGEKVPGALDKVAGEIIREFA